MNYSLIEKKEEPERIKYILPPFMQVFAEAKIPEDLK